MAARRRIGQVDVGPWMARKGGVGGPQANLSCGPRTTMDPKMWAQKTS